MHEIHNNVLICIHNEQSDSKISSFVGPMEIENFFVDVHEKVWRGSGPSKTLLHLFISRKIKIQKVVRNNRQVPRRVLMDD